jgi:hypothetical protein
MSAADMIPIALSRLRTQQLAQSQPKSAGEVIAWMGAMQGQDYTGSKWSFGLRIQGGSTDAEVERAIADRAVLRTWVMRGTLHFVHPADIHWIAALIAPRLNKVIAQSYTRLELDEPTLARANELIVKALESGKPMSRTAIFDMLEKHGIAAKGGRGYRILMRASLDGLIAQLTAPKNVPTFIALPPAQITMDENAAITELARRYFTSHAPATLNDFVWWSGLPVGVCRKGLEAVRPKLQSETFEGKTYWFADLPADAPNAPNDPDVILLPGFDEYLISYRDRSASLDPQYANTIVPGGNGVFKNTILSSGRVVGTWKRTFKKDTCIVSAEPFTALSAQEQDGFAEAVQRYGEFLQMKVTVS